MPSLDGVGIGLGLGLWWSIHGTRGRGVGLEGATSVVLGGGDF